MGETSKMLNKVSVISLIKFDGSFGIATGRSRKETKWKNHEIFWREFLDRVSNTVRTQ